MSKVFKIIMLSLLSIFLITGCGTSTKDASTEDTSSAKTIKVGVFRINDCLPFFLAESEKLYEKNNVKVELVPFNSARDKDLALEAGEIDADLTDLIVTAFMKKGGADVKVVSLSTGATPKEGRFAIISAPNSNIKNPEDLKNVPIAISNNTIIHYLAEKMPQELGLNKEDIKTQSIPDLKLRLEALLEGKDVKAALLPDPLATLAQKSGANVVIDDTTLEKNLSQAVIVFRNEVIEKNPTEVKAVVKSFMDAAALINERPEDYRDLMIEKSRIPEPLKANFPVPHFTPGALPTSEMITDIMNWMVEKDLLEKAYTYEELVNDSFVK